MTLRSWDLHGSSIGETLGNTGKTGDVVCLSCWATHKKEERIITSHFRREGQDDLATEIDFGGYFHHCPFCRGAFFYRRVAESRIIEKLQFTVERWAKKQARKNAA